MQTRPHDSTPTRAVLFDGQRLTDDALARLARAASHVIAIGPDDAFAYLAYRWLAAGGRTSLPDGGYATDLADVVHLAARHEAMLVATPVPPHPLKAIHSAMRGLDSTSSTSLPAVALHFMRAHMAPGPVAVISETRECSGVSSVLGAAIGALHGRQVDRLLAEAPTVLDRSAAATSRAAHLVGRLPTVRRLADPVSFVSTRGYSLAVHGITGIRTRDQDRMFTGDAGGRALLADIAAVLRLLDEFSGDVVAVLDGSPGNRATAERTDSDRAVLPA